MSRAFGVGALLRIERHRERTPSRTQPLDHIADHMIGANAQDIAANFGREVTISQMPGNTR